MSESTPPKDDPWSRVSYRKLVAWDRRIEREAPFLARLLDEAPDRSVVDLGCGTGEHVAWFARQGARAVGLDHSEAMLAQARDHEQKGEGRFVFGELDEASRALVNEELFGLAICLGNVLPHVLEADRMIRIAHEVAAVLHPGGTALFQILNYERILTHGERHLPLNFRPGDGDDEIVFLRLMRPISRERILFYPTTLHLNPGAEQPVTVQSTRRVELRPWTFADLGPSFEEAGFALEAFGSMQGDAFDPGSSSDLVVRARLR
ncbi:MAG: class I SAM-dependent methyltransferase [Planctomycetes bacterium]|nr:class I SAM-dependent methyltransferase [Planctomycetota bacterium]